jgi:formylglycine-generating enzyme required for sulfatase activity
MEPILRTLRQTLILSGCLLAALSGNANNIQVANASLAGNNSISAFAFVQFDVSWENSWKGNGINNWDAAWIFAKYRTAGGEWQHIQFNNTGHTAPSGSQIDLGLLTPGTAFNATTNPVIGTFLSRSAEGTGTFNATGVQLRWNYGLQGLNYADIAEVRVFAIEMVYVPQGAFAAGSGGTETLAFTLTTINTANATTAPAGTGSLGGQAGGYPTGQTAPTSASWPNGFNAFYCMKYEVTQQGYVDFLNTLTYTQQVTRTATAPNNAAGTGALSSTNANRNGIDIQTPGVASTTPAVYACNLNGNTTYGEAADGKDIACNRISWGDLTAYLDWSGLRPMTELEFEKACRGTIAPVANEYPWGTAGLAASAYTLANVGATNEGIATNYSTTLGNASYDNTDGALNGPLRVGIFAANGSNSGRVTAGASYYGIMELGGNLWERPVTMGNVEGRAFTGLHGNGALAADGNPDGAAWPAPASALGAGFRGGAWDNNATNMQVSDRNFAAVTGSGRSGRDGGRGARLAP